MLHWAGILLLLCGAFHLLVWARFGGSWEGSVSWRKPILFGFSTGLTVLSMSWIYPRLSGRRYDRWICPLFALALLTEVALITLQQWRGVASHFNRDTSFDAEIEHWMTWLITFATIVIADVTIRSVQSFRSSEDVKLAIRAGLVFLLFSCLIGFAILFYGQTQIFSRRDPSVVGNGGVAKFPHGVTIHAVQLLPALCWVMKRARLPQRLRWRITTTNIASLSFLLIFSISQTMAGRSRYEFNLFSSPFLFLAVGFAMPQMLVLFQAWCRHFRRRLFMRISRG